MKSKNQADAFIVKCLQGAIENLLPHEERGVSVAPHNLERELAGAFPGCRMAVTRYGGDLKLPSVVVSWMDGPAVEHVQGFCDRFKRVVQDTAGNEVYRAETPWMRAFGSVAKVHLQRRHSVAAVREVMRDLASKYGEPFGELAKSDPKSKEMQALLRQSATISGQQAPAAYVIAESLRVRSWKGRQAA